MGSRYGDWESHLSVLEETFRATIRTSTPLEEIDSVIVFGESAGDLALHVALSRVLGERYDLLMEKDAKHKDVSVSAVDELFAVWTEMENITRRDGSGPVDPGFAAAGGMA